MSGVEFWAIVAGYQGAWFKIRRIVPGYEVERQWYDADGTWHTRTRPTKITEFWNTLEEVALHQSRECRESGRDQEQKLLVESKDGEHAYYELEGKEISMGKDVLEDDEHDKRCP